MTNLKILVVYHKKSPLFKSNVLVPIHAGRLIAKEKSKDGVISDADLEWLLRNMIGDDTGDNISHLNRQFNEMTAIYWAWKNYEKLGSPEYIGLCHYRRLFRNVCVPLYFQERIKKHAAIVSYQDLNYLGKSHKDKWDKIGLHYAFTVGKEAFLKIHPDMKDAFRKWENDRVFHPWNMFVFNKDDFFRYCEWIFPVLFEMYKNMRFPEKDSRNVGYFAEELTSFFIEYFINGPLAEEAVSQTLASRSFLFQKCKLANGQRYIYFLGIKIFSYKKKPAR